MYLPTIASVTSCVGLLDPLDHLFPFRKLRRRVRQPQPLHHQAREALPLEHDRHFVDAVGVHRVDHGFRVDVAEEGDLLFMSRVSGSLERQISTSG